MNLPELNQWEAGIYQLEQTDLVLGGPTASGGISNLQAEQLGNRTAYLYDQLGRYNNVMSVTLSLALNTLGITELSRNHVVITPPSTGSLNTMTIDPTGMKDGSIISISIAGTSTYKGKIIRLQLASGFSYHDVTHQYATTLFLYSGESVKLVKAGTVLIVIAHQGTMYEVGEFIYSFRQPLIPAVEAKGQMVNRSDYPRLWNWLNGITLITEAQYNVAPLQFSGCFTSGNGLTTFRLPDLRGAFMRGLDNGRGLDVDRVGNTTEGGYQADGFKAHKHKVPNGGGNPTGGASVTFFANYYNIIQNPLLYDTAAEGGNETRPKNVAYTAYIKI